jgi:hypothetical protein
MYIIHERFLLPRFHPLVVVQNQTKEVKQEEKIENGKKTDRVSERYLRFLVKCQENSGLDQALSRIGTGSPRILLDGPYGPS